MSAGLGRAGAHTCNHNSQETEGGALDRCSADQQVWASNSPSKTLGQPRGASAVSSFSEALVPSMSRIFFGVGKTITNVSKTHLPGERSGDLSPKELQATERC